MPAVGAGKAERQPRRHVLGLAQGTYPDIEASIKYGRAINRQFAHPAGQAAALMYKFQKSDPQKAEDLFQAWIKGQRNGKYQIIDTMQALLHSQKANNNGRIHELVRAAVIIKAWNIFKAGHKGSLQQLQAAMSLQVEAIA